MIINSLRRGNLHITRALFHAVAARLPKGRSREELQNSLELAWQVSFDGLCLVEESEQQLLKKFLEY